MWNFIGIFTNLFGSPWRSIRLRLPQCREARKIGEYSRIFYEDNNINKGTINCRTYWEVPEYSMHSFAQSMYSFAQSE